MYGYTDHHVGDALPVIAILKGGTGKTELDTNLEEAFSDTELVLFPGAALRTRVRE